MSNVKGTLLKSLISKPVAAAKKKEEMKASLILKHYFFPPSKQDNSLWKTLVFRSKECLACLFLTVYKTLQYWSVASGTTENRPNDHHITKIVSSESIWGHHGTPGALKTPIIFLKIQKLSRYMWTICWTISFRHKDITETSEEHWGKNYINANIF